jgi:type VI protein secretion system component Hcp
MSLAAASSAWAVLIFLHIAGVTGTVSTTGFVGDIPMEAYSQGFSNNGPGSTPQCSDISFTRSIDVTSQYFSRRVLEEAGPFTATLYFVNSGTLIADTTITLHNVSITSVQHSGASGSGSVSESIAMYATSQTVTFTSGGTTNSYSATCAALP